MRLLRISLHSVILRKPTNFKVTILIPFTIRDLANSPSQGDQHYQPQVTFTLATAK